MREAFERVGLKRLSDIFRKARRSSKWPNWIEPTVWDALLAHWATGDFKALTTQNKVNRASTRGGVLHTTGRTPHHEVA